MIKIPLRTPVPASRQRHLRELACTGCDAVIVLKLLQQSQPIHCHRLLLTNSANFGELGHKGSSADESGDGRALCIQS